MLPIAVARFSSGGVAQSLGKGQFWGVFFPIDNALYSEAYALDPYENGWIDQGAVWVNDLGGPYRYHC